MHILKKRKKRQEKKKYCYVSWNNSRNKFPTSTSGCAYPLVCSSMQARLHLSSEKLCICKAVRRIILCCFRELLQLSLLQEMSNKKNFKRAFAYQIIIKRLEITLLPIPPKNKTKLSISFFIKKKKKI